MRIPIGWVINWDDHLGASADQTQGDGVGAESVRDAIVGFARVS